MKRHICIITFILTLGLCIGFSCHVNAQTLTEFAKQKQQEIEERQRVEKQKYEEACNIGTLAAFENYAKLYPKSKYIKDVNNRIADYSLWSYAKAANTLYSYNQYIQKSEYKTFENEAQSAIAELKSQEMWNNIKSSEDKNVVKNFISTYPNSSCKEKAQKRLCELDGAELYKKGYLLFALDKFDQAGGKYNINRANQLAYDKCKEFKDYKNIISEADGDAFLKKYPDSDYYNDVSNNLAVMKANNMSIFVTEYEFQEVLAYAKDETTRNKVELLYSEKREAYNRYRKQERKDRVMANGGYVQFGFEPCEMGLNTNHSLNIFYYNVGASVKIGNYRAPVQFEVGLKLGLLVYGYDYGDDLGKFSDAKCGFHMPIFAKLKLNLCSVGSSCKLYAAGIAAYNAKKVKSVENDFSAGGGLGFAWKKWDWLPLYYKQDVGNKHNQMNKFFGMSVVSYF